MFAGGRRSVQASTTTTSAVITPMAANTVPRPSVGARLTDSVPRMSEPRPKPIMSTPDEKPTLSGNHTLVVAMTEL